MNPFPLEIYTKPPQFSYKLVQNDKTNLYKERKIVLEIFRQIGILFSEFYYAFKNPEYSHFRRTDKLKLNAFKLVRQIQILAGFILYPFSSALSINSISKAKDMIECYDEYLKGVEEPFNKSRNLSKITLSNFINFTSTEQKQLIDRYDLGILEQELEKVKTFSSPLLINTTLDDLYTITIYCKNRLNDKTLLADVNRSVVFRGSNAALDLLIELVFHDKEPFEQLPDTFSPLTIDLIRRLTSDQINQLIKDNRFYDLKAEDPRENALPFFAIRFFSIKQIQGIDLTIASPRIFKELLEVKDASTLRSCFQDNDFQLPELKVEVKPDVNLDNDPRFLALIGKLEARLNNKEYVPSTANLSMDPDAENKVKEYFPETSVIPDGITSTVGGNSKVLFFNKASHIVFKHPKMASSLNQGYKELFTSMEDINRQAEAVCVENNLYLFHVPKCKIISCNRPKEFLFLQEKIELESGSYRFHQSLWRALIYSKHPIARAYAKEFLKQLATFICKMQYSDVKFDNFPISKDGFISPIDFDNGPKDALVGVTKGMLERYHTGLFKYVPYEWFDEIAEHVSSMLSEEDNEKFQNQLPLLKLIVHKREDKIARDLQFKKIEGPINFEYNNVYLTTIESNINHLHEQAKGSWEALSIRKYTHELTYPYDISMDYKQNERSKLRLALSTVQKTGKIARFNMIGDTVTVVY